MELSEFVKQSLTQIVQGVKDAQQAVAQTGGIVNPSVSTTAAGSAATFGYTAEGGLAAMLVTFDVAVTISSGSGGAAGGKLSVAGMFNVGGEASQTRTDESTSRIQFKVPLALPIDRQTQLESERRKAEEDRMVRAYNSGQNYP